MIGFIGINFLRTQLVYNSNVRHTHTRVLRAVSESWQWKMLLRHWRRVSSGGAAECSRSKILFFFLFPEMFTFVISAISLYNELSCRLRCWDLNSENIYPFCNSFTFFYESATKRSNEEAVCAVLSLIMTSSNVPCSELFIIDEVMRF